jgi:hypothetical protein
MPAVEPGFLSDLGLRDPIPDFSNAKIFLGVAAALYRTNGKFKEWLIPPPPPIRNKPVEYVNVVSVPGAPATMYQVWYFACVG